MFFTLVPDLIGFGAPFTGKSLITITLSPLINLLPFTSFIVIISSSINSLGFHL